MSGASKSGDDARRSILGEFSAAHQRDFEQDIERDYDDTLKAQLEMSSEQLFEKNNLKQRLTAELDALGYNPENVPTYSLSNESLSGNKDRYEETMTQNADRVDLLEDKYIGIRDTIRENGETLSDQFSETLKADDIAVSVTGSDLDGLGVDAITPSNASADANYYGTDPGYSYDEHADPFVDDYSSYSADDTFECDGGIDDTGNDEGNDGGHGR